MNEMAASVGLWEMGGNHTLWWTLSEGEIGHDAVLHQEESGLEILR